MPSDQPVHPLVNQLRFTRSEFLRGVEGVSDEDAARRLGAMNCLAWNVGHLAWQEQRYWLTIMQGRTPFPEIAEAFAYGAPGSTPRLSEILDRWREITGLADPWLAELTSERLASRALVNGEPDPALVGDRMHRLLYHYWYHCGENQAIRQQLGHAGLPQYVGEIEDEAPYTPEAG